MTARAFELEQKLRQKEGELTLARDRRDHLERVVRQQKDTEAELRRTILNLESDRDRLRDAANTSIEALRGALEQ